jgi:hypothetical protein
MHGAKVKIYKSSFGYLYGFSDSDSYIVWGLIALRQRVFTELQEVINTFPYVRRACRAVSRYK